MVIPSDFRIVPIFFQKPRLTSIVNIIFIFILIIFNFRYSTSVPLSNVSKGIISHHHLESNVNISHHHWESNVNISHHHWDSNVNISHHPWDSDGNTSHYHWYQKGHKPHHHWDPQQNLSEEISLPCFITSVARDNVSHNNSIFYWKKKLSWSSFDQFSEVLCLQNENRHVPGIPDIMLNGTTYSSIDFQNSLDHQSAVAFAIDKFIFQLKEEENFDLSSDPEDEQIDQDDDQGGGQEEHQKLQKRELLIKYWKLYGAMDIALRVLNTKQSKHTLNLLKGPGFVLNFQTARLEGNVGDVEFQLGHILKNCLDCTAIEVKRLVLLAKASGVKDERLFRTMRLENSGRNISQSTNQTSGINHIHRGQEQTIFHFSFFLATWISLTFFSV